MSWRFVRITPVYVLCIPFPSFLSSSFEFFGGRLQSLTVVCFRCQIQLERTHARPNEWIKWSKKKSGFVQSKSSSIKMDLERGSDEEKNGGKKEKRTQRAVDGGAGWWKVTLIHKFRHFFEEVRRPYSSFQWVSEWNKREMEIYYCIFALPHWRGLAGACYSFAFAIVRCSLL